MAAAPVEPTSVRAAGVSGVEGVVMRATKKLQPDTFKVIRTDGIAGVVSDCSGKPGRVRRERDLGFGSAARGLASLDYHRPQGDPDCGTFTVSPMRPPLRRP